jgi:hypothetical protein
MSEEEGRERRPRRRRDKPGQDLHPHCHPCHFSFFSVVRVFSQAMLEVYFLENDKQKLPASSREMRPGS